MVNSDLIFFGIQGSGKGTQAARIVDDFGLTIFEMGAQLRSLSEENSDLGKKVKSIIQSGELVSDDIVMEIVEDFVNKHDRSTRILFDGIPRTINQANMLIELLKKHDREVTGVFIDLSEQSAIERLLLRKRSDDTEEGIKKRFENYHSSTVPVIEEFKARNALIHINGDQLIDDVTNELKSAIEHYEQSTD